MISIQSFRLRIGIFNQIKCSRTQFRALEKTGHGSRKCLTVMSVIMLVCVVWSLCKVLEEYNYVSGNIASAVKDSLEKNENYGIRVWTCFTGNFYARYVNGNIVNSQKGLKVYHINIRSLKNKVEEVKSIVKDKKPHILGCTECELSNEHNENQLSRLKVPGYQTLLPKSWVSHDYARVVVYVKNSLNYERVHELEDEHLQTIWVKAGFQNSKSGFFVQVIENLHLI